MTDFPPSDNSELPEDPERSQSTEPETPLDEVHSDSKHKEVPPTKRPFLMTEGGEHSEPPARPELFDDAAWSRMGPQTLYARLFRPLFNLVLLGVALLPALVLIAVISIANWIAFRDRQKIFFKQYRMGYRDKPFKLWKFRTMKDSTRPNYETWTKGQEADRVTKLGSFLRRSHLDELPQLFNVLRREMNFIGPRPEMLEINDWVLSEIPLFYRRLAVKPGITGLAQINQGYVGNNVDEYRHKLRADLSYIKDLSFLQDLGILIVTPLRMLFLRGWNKNHSYKGDDELGTTGENRRMHPVPRPGVPSNYPAQILEEIDPIPPV